jgi:quercetin dioxygenase-like cupin family protein
MAVGNDVAVRKYVSVRTLGTTKDEAALSRGIGYMSERQGAKAVFYHNGEGMRLLVYLEFVPGLIRADHFHREKTEHLAVLSGTIEAKFALPEEPGRVLTHILQPGDVLTVAPGCVHSYRAAGHATAAEFSPDEFNADDIIAFPIPW